MTEKILPLSEEKLRAAVEKFGTPFHLYDEQGIRLNMRRLLRAFSGLPDFKEYFSVKAAPNPYLMQILCTEGAGADCSSLPELILAEKVGLRGSEIVFSSNDTPAEEYRKAMELGALINLDDLSHLPFLREICGLPEIISFRYNPGPARQGNAIIGRPEEAKYGVSKEQLFAGFEQARAWGVKRFGIHTMLISNELNPDYFIDTARMMFELAGELFAALGLRLEFINLGGGVGIPYRPEENPVDLEYLGRATADLYAELIAGPGLGPLRVALECGRMVTGPFGWLVTTVRHKKDIYKQYIGLDACMADLMRPALYGAYHHITPLGKTGAPYDRIYDVTGSLCENNDKFAVDRPLPFLERGDILVVHDTGAHGHAMGFNYNGKLRSKELLLGSDGEIRQIRRAETLDDYFATLDFTSTPSLFST
ncbi:MAG: diaminopimelate decarboxylase [Gracilibacteraceae bacterium]|jgi:diaminopimelate decarboxylase|nr:diaminopimelate decarboxylase [Gracilibacteraceae bacterium]